jgi:hypothetical protein
MKKRYNNNQIFEFKELCDFLSIGDFSPSSINRFLDEMYFKYKFNRYVRLKIKDSFTKLKITIPEHIFFTHFIIKNTEKNSIKTIVNTLKFGETLPDKSKYLSILKDKLVDYYKSIIKSKSFDEIQEKVNMSSFRLSKFYKKCHLSDKIYCVLNPKEFTKLLCKIVESKIPNILKLTYKEMKYKKYIIRKNSILSLMQYTAEPFIESSERAFDSIKYARNQKKIILINSK